MKNKIIPNLILTIVLISMVFHYWKLDQVPHGYHVDEYATAVGMKCLATENTGPWGQENPFFMHMGYGTPKPPIYNWIAVTWGKFFGYDPESMRLLTVVFMSVGVVGIFVLGTLIGGVRCGYWAMLAGAISPWVWVTGRVGYESLFAPVAFVWSLVFFWRHRNWLDYLLAGVLLSGAMYFYPTARVYVPLIIPFLFLVSLSWKMKMSSYLIWLLGLIIPSIPLVQGVLSGELQGRFNEISIAAPAFLASIGKTTSFGDIAGEFVKNYQLHLSPMFLIFNSGPTYIHSTLHFGIFSWLDCLALVLLIILPLMKSDLWQQHWRVISFILVSFFICLIPASLTNSEIPSAVRVAMGWPLMCVLVGLVLTAAAERFRAINWAAIVLAGSFATCFFITYFGVYAQESKGMFTFWVKEQSTQLNNDTDWLKFMVMNHKLDYHIRYYLMKQKGESCSQSFQTWENVGRLMKQNGIQ